MSSVVLIFCFLKIFSKWILSEICLCEINQTDLNLVIDFKYQIGEKKLIIFAVNVAFINSRKVNDLCSFDVAFIIYI